MKEALLRRKRKANRGRLLICDIPGEELLSGDSDTEDIQSNPETRTSHSRPISHS